LRRTPADVKIVGKAEPQRSRRAIWDRRAHICADNGCDSMPGGTAAMQQIPIDGVKSNG